jgi:TetR/AcrR family transcriptional regulator
MRVGGPALAREGCGIATMRATTSVKPSPARRRKPTGRPRNADPQATRKALMQAVRALLAERGAGPITLSEVARHAGITPAMASYYFGGKAELFAAVIEEITGELLERMRGIAVEQGSPAERLRRRVRLVMDLYVQNPYINRLLKEEMLYARGPAAEGFLSGFPAAAVALTRRILQDGVAAGEFRAVDPVFLWVSMVGMCEFFFHARPIIERLLPGNRVTRAQELAFADHVADLILHGISAAATAKTKPKPAGRRKS